MTDWKYIHQDDLKKLTKSQLIDWFNSLQDYAMSLEQINNDKTLVRVDSNLFLGINNDFLDETLTFIKDLSDLEIERSGETVAENWVKIDGKIRPNFGITYISRELSLSTSKYQNSYLIPAKIVEPLKNYFYAIKNKLWDMQKFYEKEGKNFLIQQINNDIIGHE